MTEYIIKTYEKGMEDEQAKLGTETTKDWTGFGQSTAENLKTYYAREDFDPETRLYAYKDDKLVGFMVARILPDAEDGIKRAQHDFPLALEGSEEVGKLLYNKAVETLKKKGVKILEARVSKGWGKTLELAEKLEYKKSRVLYVRTEAEISKLKMKETKQIFDDFDPEKDSEQLVQWFIDKFNMTKEQAEANIDGIIKSEEGYYAQPIIREGDKIVTRGLVYVPKEEPVAVFRPLTPNPKKNFDAYLAKITEFAKEKGAEKFQVFFGGPALDDLDFYKSFGFEVISKVLIFEKEI
ncbi:MAG: hypothetical protein ACTSSH_00670 [Candidatus Heimdallarchaeota archaeon]